MATTQSAVYEPGATLPVGEARVRVEASPPAGARFYRPELDAMRFFAFLAVFVHHGLYTFAPLVSIAGGFGLSFFFFLSAFLITELLLRELGATGTVSIRDFYARRILRIWPLYLLALLGAVLWSVLDPGHRITPVFVLSYLFMLGNVYIGRLGFPHTPVGYLWSISIEEQFYLLWPLASRLLSVRGLGLLAGACLAAGSAATLLLSHLGATPSGAIWTDSLVEFQFFALGALLAIGLGSRVPRLPSPMRGLLLISGLLLWLGAARYSGIDSRLGSTGWAAGGHLLAGYWAVGLGCAALLGSVLGVARASVPSPLVYLGKISYGLYVFHQGALEGAEALANHLPGLNSRTHHAAFGLAHLLLGFVFTVGLAAVSYRFYEKPFLRWKEHFTRVPSRAA